MYVYMYHGPLEDCCSPSDIELDKWLWVLTALLVCQANVLECGLMQYVCRSRDCIKAGII